MSAIAGVFWRNTNGQNTARRFYFALSQAVRSVAAERHLTEVVKPNCLLVKCDYAVYDGAGIDSDGSGSVSAICGHPYVGRLAEQPRPRHLEYLAAAAREERFAEFSETCGSFTFVRSEFRASEQKGRLVLAADCLGVRPLYYADCGDMIVFSSTLAAIRGLGDQVTGPIDERGSVELGVLGFCLGDRTNWSNVKCVPPGTAVVLGDGENKEVRYWSMSGVPPAEDLSEKESLQDVFDRFGEAVSLRVGKCASAMATLSGGLDSRVVVASLRSRGVQVDSVNFAPAGSQDLVYGREIAAAMGCRHTEIPMDSGAVIDRTTAAMRALQARAQDPERSTDQPNLIWSGDGGSVLLGHVYLTEEMVQAAEDGKFETAVDHLIEDQSWYVPRRILRRAKASTVAGYPRLGLLESLSDAHSGDPGRRLHVMLMATDQRRHMHSHFERIYEHRCEVQLPFFDRKVVEAVIGRPVRPFLKHRFYNRWLALFPRAVSSVPWQAYPGHEACPIGERSGVLTYQWTAEFSSASRRNDRRKYLSSTWSALRAGRYGGTVVSPVRLSLALLATALGVRDLTYALRFTEAMAKQ